MTKAQTGSLGMMVAAALAGATAMGGSVGGLDAVRVAPGGTVSGVIASTTLDAVRLAPEGHVAVPALDETGCRVPMLVWRCRGDVLTLTYAFDMEIAAHDAAALRVWPERAGAGLATPAAWPLTRNRRNVEVPAPVAAQIGEGGEVHLRLNDPGTGSELLDRFDLSALPAALATLPCAPD